MALTAPRGDRGLRRGSAAIERASGRGADPGEGLAIPARSVDRTRQLGSAAAIDRFAGNWRLLAVNEVGVEPATAIDDTGRVHLAWGTAGADQRGLGCAYRATGQWYFAAPPSESGGFRGFAVAPDGTPHFLYLERGRLVHARAADGEWRTEDVTGPGATGWHARIALDGNGPVHVVAVGIRGGAQGIRPAQRYVIYTTNASGAWRDEVIAGGYDQVALAIDHEGVIHLVAGEGLLYGRRTSGGWAWQEIEAASSSYGALFPSLAVRDGHLGIVYTASDFTTDGSLVTWARTDGPAGPAFARHPIAAGTTPSLAMSPDGVPVVAFMPCGGEPCAGVSIAFRR